ncbi:MAG: hypothetical protein L3J44_06550 [Campylobacteraceae bacterium]|nr:hypothetical protein [Campylobacteraceae bacterium]
MVAIYNREIVTDYRLWHKFHGYRDHSAGMRRSQPGQDYQPWENERYDQDANHSVLVEHVSSFKFRQDGETIRLKLCIRDDKVNDTYGFCKEKVIF